MKKSVCLMVLCLLLVGILLPAQAVAADNWDYVTDLAGILSDSERSTLENQAAQISAAMAPIPPKLRTRPDAPLQAVSSQADRQ